MLVLYGFADGPVYALGKAAVRSQMRDASRNLGADKVFNARYIVWSVDLELSCCLGRPSSTSYQTANFSSFFCTVVVFLILGSFVAGLVHVDLVTWSLGPFVVGVITLLFAMIVILLGKAVLVVFVTVMMNFSSHSL